MKPSLKFLIASLSACGLAFSSALPSRAQSQFTPNPGTTPANAAPTNRDTGVPPIQGTPNQTAPNSETTPSNDQESRPNNSPSQNTPGDQNQSVPGVVNPANRPTGTPSTDTTSFTGSEDQSIDQIVRTNRSFELFNALLRVAESQGTLPGALAGSANYTVFAPTDEALAAIPPETFKALVQPENRAVLAQVLENHIVAGKVSSSDLAAKQVRSLGGNPIAAQGGSGALTVGSARVIGADIQADNGIIHAVDQLIVTPDLQSKLTSLAPQASTNQLGR
jgi:uncharacterized surface protein with fasciclin (FAS1) repeats